MILISSPGRSSNSLLSRHYELGRLYELIDQFKIYAYREMSGSDSEMIKSLDEIQDQIDRGKYENATECAEEIREIWKKQLERKKLIFLSKYFLNKFEKCFHIIQESSPANLHSIIKGIEWQEAKTSKSSELEINKKRKLFMEENLSYKGVNKDWDNPVDDILILPRTKFADISSVKSSLSLFRDHLESLPAPLGGKRLKKSSSFRNRTNHAPVEGMNYSLAKKHETSEQTVSEENKISHEPTDAHNVTSNIFSQESERSLTESEDSLDLYAYTTKKDSVEKKNDNIVTEENRTNDKSGETSDKKSKESDKETTAKEIKAPLQVITINDNSISEDESAGTAEYPVQNSAQENTPKQKNAVNSSKSCSTQSMSSSKQKLSTNKSLAQIKHMNPLVSPKDRNFSTEFSYLCMSALLRYSRKDRKGAVCRYCNTTFFPSTYLSFRTFAFTFGTHLNQCAKVPSDLINDIKKSQEEKISHKKVFHVTLYRKCWNRINGLPDDQKVEETSSKEQNNDYTKKDHRRYSDLSEYKNAVRDSAPNNMSFSSQSEWRRNSELNRSQSQRSIDRMSQSQYSTDSSHRQQNMSLFDEWFRKQTQVHFHKENDKFGNLSQEITYSHTQRSTEPRRFSDFAGRGHDDRHNSKPNSFGEYSNLDNNFVQNSSSHDLGKDEITHFHKVEISKNSNRVDINFDNSARAQNCDEKRSLKHGDVLITPQDELCSSDFSFLLMSALVIKSGVKYDRQGVCCKFCAFSSYPNTFNSFLGFTGKFFQHIKGCSLAPPALLINLEKAHEQRGKRASHMSLYKKCWNRLNGLPDDTEAARGNEELKESSLVHAARKATESNRSNSSLLDSLNFSSERCTSPMNFSLGERESFCKVFEGQSVNLSNIEDLPFLTKEDERDSNEYSYLLLSLVKYSSKTSSDSSSITVGISCIFCSMCSYPSTFQSFCQWSSTFCNHILEHCEYAPGQLREDLEKARDSKRNGKPNSHLYQKCWDRMQSLGDELTKRQFRK